MVIKRKKLKAGCNPDCTLLPTLRKDLRGRTNQKTANDLGRFRNRVALPQSARFCATRLWAVASSLSSMILSLSSSQQFFQYHLSTNGDINAVSGIVYCRFASTCYL